MINKTVCIALVLAFSQMLFSQNNKDSVSVDRNIGLDEVVVTGTRYKTDIRHLPMTISVVTSDQIRNRYDQSLLPIINEQVPGIFITSRGILGYGLSGGGSGAMKIRGVGGDGTTGVLVLIDGQPQYMSLMGHPVADAYQSMLAERVEVLRGPASVLYGSNAMGGVVNIVSRELKRDLRQTNVRLGYGSYNTLNTEAVNKYQHGRFSNVLTASYNRTDGHRADMGFEQISGYTRLGYKLNDCWKLSGDINMTHFNASNPGKTTARLLDNDSHITRGVSSVSVENSYATTSGALRLFYNWGRHEINDGYAPNTSPKDFHYHSKDQMMGVSWNQSVSLFEGNRMTGGVDFYHFGGEAWNLFTDGERKEIVDKTQNEVAGYITIRQRLLNRLTVDAGIRLDHHSQTGTEWIPQGGISLQLPRDAELRAMVSKGFRNPTIKDLFMFKVKNEDLKPEKIMNYELSYSQRLLDNALSYGVNLFFMDGKNIIQLEDGRIWMNIDKIKNWGVEATLNYRLNTVWAISANYSWLHMKYPVIAAPEHKLYAGVNFIRGKWRMDSGVQYIKGLYTNTKPETQRKENFVLWNAQGSYHVCPFATLFFKLENILAQRYEINEGYPMPRTTFMAGVTLSF